MRMQYFVYSALIIGALWSNIVEAKQQVLQISDTRFEQPLEFNVQLPKNYDSKLDKDYVLMFDFNPYSKSYLKGMHDWMSHNGEWPWLETIIVTPAHGNPVAQLYDATGKTTPLLDFFESQLIPKIDQQYRTNGYRIFSGFRVNGSIVLSSLVNKPNLFNAHIVVSPELDPERIKILEGYGAKLGKLDMKPRYLLFTHGDTIKEDHQKERYSTLRKAISSNAPTSLEWHYKDLSERYFMSLPVISTAMGIEHIFDDVHNGLAPESHIAQQGVNAIIKHYEHLSSNKYGFEVSPKSSINALGFYWLNKSTEKGITIFKQALEQYPNDAYAYHHLARAYMQDEQYDKAIKLQERAVILSKSMLTWHQKRQARYLAEFRQTEAEKQ